MEKNYKILNRDQIKYLAIVLMTFNHIAHILMTPGTVVYEVFEDMGYFTSITMCYFLVEGYFYTHSKRELCKAFVSFRFNFRDTLFVSHGLLSVECYFYFPDLFLYIITIRQQTK